MADFKKPSYLIAFNERQQQTEDQIKSEHHGPHESEDPEVQIRPRKDSIQLGEGSHEV